MSLLKKSRNKNTLLRKKSHKRRANNKLPLTPTSNIFNLITNENQKTLSDVAVHILLKSMGTSHDKLSLKSFNEVYLTKENLIMKAHDILNKQENRNNVYNDINNSRIKSKNITPDYSSFLKNKSNKTNISNQHNKIRNTNINEEYIEDNIETIPKIPSSKNMFFSNIGLGHYSQVIPNKRSKKRKSRNRRILKESYV